MRKLAVIGLICLCGGTSAFAQQWVDGQWSEFYVYGEGQPDNWIDFVIDVDWDGTLDLAFEGIVLQAPGAQLDPDPLYDYVTEYAGGSGEVRCSAGSTVYTGLSMDLMTVRRREDYGVDGFTSDVTFKASSSEVSVEGGATIYWGDTLIPPGPDNPAGGKTGYVDTGWYECTPTSSAPDGGITLLLLGMATAAVRGVRRFIA